MRFQDTYLGVFANDTCVLIVAAYLLTRVGLLRLLFKPRLRTGGVVVLGLSLGFVGLAASLLMEPRFPYAAHTLFSAFATILAGMPVGLIAAGIVSIGATPRVAIGSLIAVLMSGPLAKSIRRSNSLTYQLQMGIVTGALAQSGRLLAHAALQPFWHSNPLPLSSLATIPANGFGIALLQLVVHDARVRADSENRRIEAERAQTVAIEAQLSALRAQIRPHFLFNAINAIAALCRISPERAETACVNLGKIMRRGLEVNSSSSVAVRDEAAVTRAYAQIEQERFGDRLHVSWSISPESESCRIPPFSIQTLVENAINHGIAPKAGKGCVEIVVRRSRGRVLIAICDDGVGIGPDIRRQHTSTDSRVRGMEILNRQLELLYGRRGRLHIFTGAEQGTIAAFRIPMSTEELPS